MPTPAPHKQPHQTQWEKVKLGDIGEVITGKTPSTDKLEYWDSKDYMFITPPDLKRGTTIYQASRYISAKGLQSIKTNSISGFSILVGCIGSDLGNIACVDSTCATNQQINALTNIKPQCNTHYVYHYLTLLKKYFRQIAAITTAPIVSKSMFENIKIPLPPLPTQENIAQILSTLDKKIELNTRINTELESMAKLLYTRYFVEFNFPDSSGKPYKASGGAMVYSPTLKREIPQDWEVASLANNQLCTPISPKVDKFQGEKIYLPTSAIQGWDIVDFTTRTTYENRISRANMQPQADSVWFAKMKDTNKTLYFGDYSQSIHTLILSTGMCGLSCKKNALEYIWNFINSNYFNVIKNAFANGSTQKAINDENLDFIHLVIPSEEVLKDFHKATYNLYKQKYLNQQESQRLAEWRDYLLPLLMGDQVEVV